MKDRTRSFSLILLTAVVLLLASCRDSRTAVSLSQGDTLQLKYAKNITIVRHDGYTTVSMANPWKPGKTLHRYVLVPREGELPEQMPEGSVLRVPLQRSAVFTTVHCALIEMLGCEESVGRSLMPFSSRHSRIAAATARWKKSMCPLWSVPSIWKTRRWHVLNG